MPYFEPKEQAYPCQIPPTFLIFCKRAAAAGLPGPEAHRIMAPQYRVVKPFREEDFPGSRKASVLALLYAKNEAVQVVLTADRIMKGYIVRRSVFRRSVRNA